MAQATCSIEGCDKPVDIKCRQWCKMHYTRWRRHGNPHVRLSNNPAEPDRLAAILRATHPDTDDCILLPCKPDDRPKIVLNGVRMAVSRAVWILANGDPGQSLVLHRCNGGSGSNGCINLRHLYLGDVYQNRRDAIASGRHARGESLWTAKLTEAEVLEIRRLHSQGTTLVELARRFPVSPATLSSITHRRTWRHI